MSAPRRIQRKRTKGWRMPDGAIYVGRPTRWGNPWRVGSVIGCELDDQTYRYCGAIVTPAIAVALYESALTGPALHANTVTGLDVTVPDLAVLAGHDLACWCPLDGPCHADVLLRLANEQVGG